MKLILVVLCGAELLQAQLFQQSFAIVIGVHVYEAAATLPNARNDAESISAILAEQGYRVTSLYDRQAKRAAILDAIDQVAQRASEHDRVVFFFAGHGTTIPRGGRDWGYIVPYDGRDQQSSTLIGMEELQTASAKMGNARHQLFLMDSCYGGSIARDIPRGVSRNSPNYLSEITRRVAREALTAGGKDQTVEDGASGHSIFTEALLEALQDGKADLDGDGIITFSELSSYVLRRATTMHQTPGRTLLPGDGMGEYWFVSPANLHPGNQKAARDGAGRSRSLEEGEYWVDPVSFLMWTRKNNEFDSDQPTAVRYCADLRTAGYQNWRLANLDELKGVYDPRIVSNRLGELELHAKGPIVLSASSVWSSSVQWLSIKPQTSFGAGNPTPSAFAATFDFSTGATRLNPINFHSPHSMLCVSNGSK